MGVLEGLEPIPDALGDQIYVKHPHCPETFVARKHALERHIPLLTGTVASLTL
jgi:hypothetical protein